MSEQEYLRQNIETVAFHLGQPGARMSVAYDGDSKLVVEPGAVLAEASRRLASPPPVASAEQVTAEPSANAMKLAFELEEFAKRGASYEANKTMREASGALRALPSATPVAWQRRWKFGGTDWETIEAGRQHMRYDMAAQGWQIRPLYAFSSPERDTPREEGALPSDLRWQTVNDDGFEYAVQQGPYGDEFVKLLNDTCLRRPLYRSVEVPPPSDAVREGLEASAGVTNAATSEIAELRKQLVSARAAMTEAADYLENRAKSLTGALERQDWTPRRSHIESDRNSLVSVENTLRQALSRLTDEQGAGK